MSESRPHLETVPIAEYQDLYPQRLALSEIDEQQLLSLMMTSFGPSPEAFRGEVRLDEIHKQLGGVILQTIFLDADLRPATRGIDSVVDTSSQWHCPEFSIMKAGRSVRANQGFFVPYESGEADDFLRQASELELVRVR